MLRRDFLLTPAALLAAGDRALAQDAFPAKPIHFVIPTTPGSVTDSVARLYGESMARSLKQPILTDYMAGGETVLAVRHVLGSAPDGYTLIVSANTVVTQPYVNPAVGYTPGQFTGVSFLSKMHMLLVVGAESPHKSLADLVAAAKKEAEAVTFASVGVGTTSHIPVELFARAAGIKLRMVPYKGIPLAIPDVATARVDFMMGTPPSVGDLVKAGKLRALAVTSSSRSASFPAVPSFAELGYDEATYELFLGLMAATATPPAVVAQLAAAAEEAKKDPVIRSRLQALGQELSTQSDPQQFNAFLRREEERMKTVVRQANIRATPG